MLTAIVIYVVPLFIVFVLHTLYVAYLGPLSNIPNAHWTAPLSQAWQLWTKWTMQENGLRRDAHLRLGPVVRVGPNEIAVNCFEQGVQTMSGNVSFDKARWYFGSFNNYGIPPMFAILAGRQHDERKRMVYKPYTNSRVQSSANLTQIIDSILLTKLQANLKQWSTSKAPVEVLATSKAIALDLTSAYLFGLRHSTDLLGDPEAIKTYIGAFQGSFMVSFFVAEIFGDPPLLKYLNLFQRPAVAIRAKAFMEQTCEAFCTRSLRQPATDEPTVVHTMKAALDAPASAGTPAPERARTLHCELLDHMVAGAESLGTTLAYLQYELSRAPAVQQALRTAELPTLAGLAPGAARARALDALPLLDAVVLETLRTRPPGLGPFPRVVPRGGARVAGRALPGGTVVSASVRCLHADPAVYDAPLEWRPRRWLDADEPALKAMRANFWAFGSGARVCVANHFSMRLMKEFVASVYARFETSVVDDSGAAQSDAVIAGPVGDRIDLAFHEVGV